MKIASLSPVPVTTEEDHDDDVHDPVKDTEEHDGQNQCQVEWKTIWTTAGMENGETLI